MGLLIAFFASLFGLPGAAGEARDPQEQEAGVTINLRTGSEPQTPLPPVVGTRDVNRPLVVIDPGHGGKDPGASSPYVDRPEKDLTLSISRAIRDELIAGGRVRVAMTRDVDSYIPLTERYQIARRLGAKLFISIHADAAPHNDGARGATIYTLSEVASDKEAALLAARQNSSDLIGGATLSPNRGVNLILIDLAQRESMDISADFARLLRREASTFFPFRPEYHRFASLIVLKAPDMPSILLESGYLTNPVDAAYIQSVEGQKQIATGMRRAIETHFARLTVRPAGTL